MVDGQIGKVVGVDTNVNKLRKDGDKMKFTFMDKTVIFVCSMFLMAKLYFLVKIIHQIERLLPENLRVDVYWKVKLKKKKRATDGKA